MSNSYPLLRAGATVVIGGGIAGSTVAYELTRQGASVTLLEERSLAHAASGRNMGLLLNQVEPEVVKIMQSSLEVYRELEAAGHTFALRAQDQLLLARDEEQLRAAERRARAIEGLGVTVSLVDAAALRGVVRGLAPDVLGGWLVEKAWAVDAAAATVAFAEAARGLGAAVRTGVRAHSVVVEHGRVTGVVTDAGRLPASAVVVATGPWMAQLLPDLPIAAARGWVLRTSRLPFQVPVIIEEMSWPDQDELGRLGGRPTLAEVAGGVYDRPVVQAFAFAQLPGGDALVGTSMAQSLRDAYEGLDMPRRLAGRAIAVMPGLASVPVVASWYGMRPMTPDGMPIAGPVPGVEGLFVHGGHGSIGMMTAPAIARWLAQGIADELGGLRPDRF